MLLTNLLLIFTGCGLGGLARYGVSNGIHWLLGRDFPYGTLAVNVSGSLLIGFLFAIMLDRMAEMGPLLRTFLLIGFLGGYTTFSSFSIETVLLIEKSHWNYALLNIFSNLFLCIGSTWIGLIIGRQL